MENNVVILPFGAMTFTFQGWIVDSGEVVAFPTRVPRRAFREKVYFLMSKDGACVTPFIKLDRGRIARRASLEIPASDPTRILRCQKCGHFSLDPTCVCGASTQPAEYDPFMALRAGNQYVYGRPYLWSVHRHKIIEALASGKFADPMCEYVFISEEGEMLPGAAPTPPRGYYILAKGEELAKLASFREKDPVWGLHTAIESMIRSLEFWMA